MCDLKRFPIVWILLHFIKLAHGWRNFDCRLESYRYEVLDKALFAHCRFALAPVKHRKVLFGSFAITRPVSDFSVQLSVDVPRDGSGDTNLIDTTINGCETLNSQGPNLLKIIISQFRKSAHGYFPLHCPVEANKTFSLENFYIDSELFPPYVPEMIFKAKFHLLSGGDYVFKSYVNGTMVTKKKKKKRTHSTNKVPSTFAYIKNKVYN